MTARGTPKKIWAGGNMAGCSVNSPIDLQFFKVKKGVNRLPILAITTKEEIINTPKKNQTQLFFTSEALIGSARKLLRTGRFLLAAPLSLIILLMAPIPTLAQSALTDDAHVILFQGDTNHGAEPILSVSPKANTYLR